ncbi:MAG TPA: hypothetical protein PLT26_16050 [Anaerolineaceae bacterium]|jgi:hypothetical protein|nr:hypothetical protein [Anaerolineaceae bacterium]
MTVKTAAQLKANFQGQDPQDFVADLVDTAEDLPTATTSVSGIVELATDAEAIAGTDTARAVTPHALAAAVPAASETVVGKVELATNAETIPVADYTRAVTPRGLGAALAKMFVISFAGHNGAGACTATGVAVNDVIFGVAGLTDVGQADASFEAVVTVADQIQQASASDLSLKNFVALVYRPS